ncbi:hypothetical protein BEI02_05660 [Elizabethkingia sp. HvH-WGS333]|jgi:hypothetical protein|uniref:Lipoprotein n=2 Tax=Elizabethkingia TaxID=308865 RepID=A0A7T7UZC1_9FLAO|nr:MULTISPECIES: hypothetical protein [Weeksellaceae]KGO09909.1 hypothetical protein KS04_12110 [Elizabethkingia miricola]MCL1641556.1 hypothetical protein [Elizabethkingia anophelis]MCL1646367.1 hypothetical protein [Elizabethkingia anophelis]MCT3940458.1 hypothetical protein [Elizabethkingia anophelis]MCT4193626.1 hypothetical protein [Elizabethkingia anophelis]
MKLKQTLISLSILIGLVSCNNDDNTFHLKTVKLLEYSKKQSLPEQKLYIKAFSEDLPVSIAQTEEYPSVLPLPATLKMYPSPSMNLYGKNYHLELWGETSGYIGRCDIDMDDYKIVFPIDMEIETDSLSISMQGSWE